MRYIVTTIIGSTPFTSKFANASAADFSRRCAIERGHTAFVTINRAAR